MDVSNGQCHSKSRRDDGHDESHEELTGCHWGKLEERYKPKMERGEWWWRTRNVRTRWVKSRGRGVKSNQDDKGNCK